MVLHRSRKSFWMKVHSHKPMRTWLWSRSTILVRYYISSLLLIITNQPVNQPVSQSINQSVNQSLSSSSSSCVVYHSRRLMRHIPPNVKIFSSSFYLLISDTDTDTLLKTYATNVRKYHSTMTVTYNSSTLQHYNVKRHQLTNECLKTLKLHCDKTYWQCLFLSW